MHGDGAFWDGVETPAQGGDARRHHPQRGAHRLIRTGALSGSIFALAIGAHVLGGGTLPQAGWLAAVLLVTVAGCVAATAVHLRLWAILLAIGVGQGVLHEALAFLASASADTVGTAGAGHHAISALPARMDMSVSTESSSIWMFGAHTAAALLTGWLLARGEALFWRVIEAIVPHRPGRPATSLAAAAPLVARVRRPRALLWCATRPSRGPPVTAVVTVLS